MKPIQKILCLILAFSFLLPIATIPMSALGESSSRSSSSPEYVLYEEDFDDVTETVTLQAGNNTSGAAKGWIYDKKSTKGSARIENGKMYISGNLYDVIYRDGGQTWGNYTLEADFCYMEDNKQWGGMLYNVQSGTKFQKVSIELSGRACTNGYDGKWTNNDPTLNFFDMTTNPDLTIPTKGTPFRMKVTVHNKTATFYYAMLNSDQTMKTEFVELLSIDNIPANAQTGSIGFMLPRKSTDFGSFWVDNIKCYSDTLVSFSEDFDSYGNTALTADQKNDALGVYFEKSNSLSSGGAELKDGALHLSGGGKNFNAIFFECGYRWTNYVLESDLTYVQESNNVGWAGLLFRANDIDNFWKGAVNIPTDSSKGQGSLNCQLSGAWYQNTNHTATYPDGPLTYGETVRLRIVVNEKTASLYAAKYVGGTLGEWTYVMTTASENKFADAHMTGTVGLIVGGSTDKKENHIYIDNLTVSRIQGADRFYQEPAEPLAADIYEPNSGIVNPPVVIQELKDTLPNVTGERAAVVMLDVDENLNVKKTDGTVLTTASSFIDTYRNCLIPAFIVDNQTEANAIAALIHEKELIDCYVVAEEANASLVKQVRLANKTTSFITGALIFNDLNTPDARKAARALVTDNMSYVAISRAALTEESAFYFALRQIAAWSYAENTADVYRGIANGYHGIISSDVSFVYDVYESITETTVSGEPVIIAHRGANNYTDVPYPENTLMGIRAAKELYGADGVEIDFGLTKDGYVVLMHDTTVDRTTNGTGKVKSLTLQRIKEFTVDQIPGKETTVPTLEEALLLAKELNVVLYCHVKENTDQNIGAFTHLVEKLDCSDLVVLFGATLADYNSNTDRVVSGTAYGLSNSPVVMDGIVFTAGNQSILSGLPSHREGVAAMKNAITPYNYQPLFYPYQRVGAMWAEESFYYQLSARGFVNTHSITADELMDKIGLTESGAVGYLTNYLQQSDDYHYAIDLSNEALTLELGKTIDLNKPLKMIQGTVQVNCGFIQLSGPTLVPVEGGLTLNEEGSVTLVYYADRTADGGSKYRVYSEPVTVTFTNCPQHGFTATDKNETHHWNACPFCGAVDEASKVEHTFGEWTESGENRMRSCACGHSETEPKPAAPTAPTNNTAKTVIIVVSVAIVGIGAGATAFFLIKKKKRIV